MKRFLSTILALMMILSSFTVFAREDASFSDVGSDLYCTEAVEALARLDILTGYSDGLYRPWYSVTRAEMVTVIVRAMGLSAEAENSRGYTGFYDVDGNHWASGYINVAVRNNIIAGVGNGYFCPDDPVKYEEAIKMVVCAEGLADDIVSGGSNWAKPYLMIADETGISSNLAAKKGDILARSDVAVMVYNGLRTDLSAPDLSIAAGTYADAQRVTITTDTPNAQIYYTTDGTEPDETSNLYTGPVTIARTSTLKAVTVKNGVLVSDTANASYTILRESNPEQEVNLVRPDAFEVSFDLNYEGADNADAPETQRIEKGGRATAPAAAPVREGYRFRGWSKSKDEGAEIFDFSSEITNHMVLYAAWMDVGGPFDVIFDLNYDTAEAAPAAQVVAYGEKAETPDNPVRAGYAFLGWSRTATGEELYNLNNFVTEDITLYAKWAVRTGEGPVSLDDDDKDVEIYAFESDIKDILVGETKTITFTAEIFANVLLAQDDVKLVDAVGNVVGIMNDNGENGDAVANDGVYTVKKEFNANELANTLYYASCKEEKSDSINIGFYREYTREDYVAADTVSTSISDIVKAGLDENGEMTETATGAVVKALDDLKASGEVRSYTAHENSIRMVLKDGLPLVYMFPMTDEYEGESDSINIITYEPYKGTLNSEELNVDMDRASDGDAQLIEARDTHYKFTGNYDLADVTLDKIHEISKAGVMIWIGHGGYDAETGSSMGTGEMVTIENVRANSRMIGNGSLEIWAGVDGKRFAITGGYVKEELKNLDGSLIYLVTCHSGQDMIDDVENRYSLAQSFIDNGAAAVVGTTEAVKCDYSHKFTMALFDRLTSGANGKFYTLSESLEYAKTTVGAADNEGTEFRIFPQNNTAALNFRLTEDEYGVIDGNFKDSDTGAAVPNALVRVYKDGSLVEDGRTDDQGYSAIKLPIGEYIIQVAAGNYYSTKYSVRVNKDETTHNETTLMINVEVDKGQAIGTIVDAHNGSPVEGITLKFRKEWNNYYGDVQFAAYTDANGVYSVENEPGHYTVEYSKYGYITGYKNVILATGEKAQGQNATITPTLVNADSFRITLTWRDHPSDLDSHITGPSSYGRFHVYFSHRDEAIVTGGYANLDLDNVSIRTNTNPETTTVVRPADGIYRYSVHDFSNGSNSSSTEMASSNAIINVYYGDSGTAVATYYVPVTAVGTIWTVCEIEVRNGQIMPPKRIDAIGSGDSSSSLY